MCIGIRMFIHMYMHMSKQMSMHMSIHMQYMDTCMRMDTCIDILYRLVHRHMHSVRRDVHLRCVIGTVAIDWQGVGKG